MRVLILAVAGLFALPAAAQQNREEAKPAKTQASPRAEAPAKPGQPVNIRIDVTINDARGAQPPVTKVVSLTAADGGTAFIRSTAEAPFGAKTENLRAIPLHVDATPRIEGSKIRLKFSLEYNAVDLGGETRQYPKMEIKQNLALVLENEKPLVIAETPDPVSDRRVSVEVKATILR
jgi:hypothetical protein